ncbi:N-acetylmuramoyl-L-alanine amidase [uncultured Ruthenibacterium sp.]|uniref:N-acetylmuramoyl-L-alanine amidase n=1 Tax=uncultured Ruthenibacterium sp. TaxID=1905347 RepID=UPI00349EFB19
MKTKQRRKHRTALWVSFAALVLAVLAAAMFFVYIPAADRTLSSAQAPEGALRAAVVRFGSTGDALQTPMDEDRILAQARTIAQQARAKGMNGLMLVVQTQEGSVYRDWTSPALESLRQNDTLFHRVDGLALWCQAANEQKLSVYAVIDESVYDETDQMQQWGLSRLARKYPVAGVRVYRPASQGALFDTYEPLDGQDGGEIAGVNSAVWTQPQALFLHAVSAARTGQDFLGAAFSWSDMNTDPQTLGLMLSALDTDDVPALLNYTPSNQLSVSYPADGATVYTDACFVMGTSDPTKELTLNGSPLERTGEQGTFGVLVSVQPGDNTYTLAQGDASVTLHIRRPVPQPSEMETEPTEPEPIPHDNTQQVEPGTAVQINGWLVSLLYDPSSDSNISETVRNGAVGVVQSCAETMRNGKITWAYQLTSGDYVLAYNTTVLGQDVDRASFTGATAQSTDEGETLSFTGQGTPVIYSNIVENTLEIHLYDTDVASDFAVDGSALVKSVEVSALPDGAGSRLVLHFDQPLWGHTVEFSNGTTQVLLKPRPVQAQDPSRPLAGISVLLDPGHGQDDGGAMGVAGAEAPVEKDVNLAVSLAAKYRLEQLGATVHMIRTDDTFLSLQERNQKITELQPDFFIAVHHNSVDLSVDANQSAGTECYYFYPAGKQLAQTLVQNVAAATGRPERGAFWGYYYVARNATCPAVLLEVGFMVNPAEYEQVTDEMTVWATGDAIARSILACVPAS